MNKGSSFSKKIPWLNPKSTTSDLEAFLESLPQAVLLIDSNSWMVSQANSKILEYTNYTRAELVGTDARLLFADWFDPLGDRLSGARYAPAPDQPVTKRLVRHDQTQVLSRLQVAPLKGQEEYALLLVEPAEALFGAQDQGGDSPTWGNLNSLLSAERELNLQAALEQALSAAAGLSGADVLIIYRLLEGKPEIRKLAGFGNEGQLPETLSMQDLVTLNQARLWESGKQPSCGLYQAARAAGIRYLVSAPVGQDTALVGLALIASTHSPPPATALEIVHMLANVTESIFQNHAHRSYLSSELEQKSLQAHRLATISDHVQEGVLRLSPDLRIRTMNPRMEQLLGYFSREVTGQDAEKILIATETLLPTLAQAQKGEVVFNLGDMRLFRRDGESFQALIRVFPVFHESQVDEILVFVQDLSEMEQFRLQAQALENRALLGELMAVFAHEVRNPINNISTGLQFMAMTYPPDDPKQENIARMLQDCDRLEELLKSVLAFSKPMEYEMEPLNLDQLLQRLLDRQRMRIAGQNIRCELQVEPGGAPISGNLRALEQVFNNLITNAVQAMGEKGGVLSLKVQPVRLSEGTLYMEVCVTDTGPGIPKEVQEKIFRPFFTTKQNGNGLGLAISKRILTAHHGYIQLSSFPGGTVFRVQLPTIEPETRKI